MNADRVNELYMGTIFTPEVQRACRERIHWICSNARGKSVLDVGCSQGIVCLILGREGFECTGIDIEPESIEYAKRELAKEGKIVQNRVRFELGDATKLDFADNTFDTVILGEIIEHLIEPQRILSEAKRVLKKNGVVIITTPFGLNPHHDHKHTFYPLSFLKLVQPFFRSEFIDTVDNYFRYCGIKDPSYNPEILSKEILLNDYLRLLQKLEERCEGKEIELYEKSSKLYEQIKNINEQLEKYKSDFLIKDQELKQIEKREKELFKTLQSREQEFLNTLLQKDKKLEEIIAKERKEFNDTLSRKDIEFKNTLLEKDKKLEEIIEKERQGFNDTLLRKDIEFKNALIEKDEKFKITLEKQLHEFTSILNKKDTDFKNELASLQKEFNQKIEAHKNELKTALAKKDEELKIKEKMWQEAVHLKEEEQKQKLYKRETELISNRRWKVGQAIVNPIELIVDFLKQPIQTTRRVFKSISRGEMPQSLGSLSVKASRVQIVPSVKDKPLNVEIKEKQIKEVSEKKITVAAILDEFSTACFAPECNLVTFRPDNWKETLEETKPEMLFVESAWRGNDGSWQYKIASYQKSMGEELVDLVNYCKSKNIPTVFWNKEDPSNFDRFIHRAPIFDYVFTTDAECIPRYQERIGHRQIFALPFAAQPSIHNPIVEKPREYNVAFAGAYYNVSFDERKKDMDIVLKPALDYDLHIYDRQQGVTGQLAEQFRFPDIYQHAIKGRLEYDEMVKAYKRYKVFLNVNSVKTSPTMFSRRVFELLACGTPVISAYARGIDEILGSDIVLFTRSEDETRKHLEHILKNTDEWNRLSVRGIRKVMDEHTYAHRFINILHTVGLKTGNFQKLMVAAIAHIQRMDDVKHAIDTLNQQTYRDFDLFLFVDKKIKKSSIESMLKEFNKYPVKAFYDITDIQQTIKNLVGDCYVWIMNCKDYYGPNFLKDAVIAVKYSNADIIGKHTHFELAPNGSTIELKGDGHEFMYVQSLVPGSVIFHSSTLKNDEIDTLLANRTLNINNRKALSIDRFNYLRNAYLTGENKLNMSEQFVLKIVI